MMKTEKEAITEFLETYKCLPCLWDRSDPMYMKKDAKRQAYKILLSKYKTIDKKATSQIVRKKIENFRSCYRREFKKVRASEAKGDIHLPSLWYFNLLTFLDEPSQGSSHTVYIRNISTESSIDGNEDQEENESKSLLAQLLMKNNSHSEPDDKLNSSDDEFKPVYIMDEDELDDNRESVETEKKDSVIITENNGETEAFGKSIGLQLKHLDSMQRNIAEKLISDIIFYGRLAKLTVDSSINI